MVTESKNNPPWLWCLHTPPLFLIVIIACETSSSLPGKSQLCWQGKWEWLVVWNKGWEGELLHFSLGASASFHSGLGQGTHLSHTVSNLPLLVLFFSCWTFSFIEHLFWTACSYKHYLTLMVILWGKNYYLILGLKEKNMTQAKQSWVADRHPPSGRPSVAALLHMFSWD